MTDEKIEAMLKDIIKEVDYDLYKGIYVSPEDGEEATEQRGVLISIVKRHLE